MSIARAIIDRMMGRATLAAQRGAAVFGARGKWRCDSGRARPHGVLLVVAADAAQLGVRERRSECWR